MKKIIQQDGNFGGFVFFFNQSISMLRSQGDFCHCICYGGNINRHQAVYYSHIRTNICKKSVIRPFFQTHRQEHEAPDTRYSWKEWKNELECKV